jgi:hypothetical protein
VAKYLIKAVAFIVLLACMLLGLFAAMGLCAAIWGPSILTTALGNPPVLTHPASITFIVVLIPSMLIGAGGAIATIIVPLYARFPTAGDRSLFPLLRSYRRILSQAIDRHENLISECKSRTIV